MDTAMQKTREIQQMLGLVSVTAGPMLPSNHRDAIFVCIDVEAFEFDQERITELGVAVLDTRDLVDVPIPSWPNAFKYAFYRPIENAKFINKRFVKGCPEYFNFGSSTWITLADAPRVLTRIFADPTQIAHAADFSHQILHAQRNVVFVGHGAKGDVSYLRTLGFDLHSDGNIAHVVDTQSAVSTSKKHHVGLQRLLLALELDAENLHNAGNDAAYTLQAMVSMAVATVERPEALFEAISRLKGGLPPAKRVARAAPQIWAGTATPVQIPSSSQALQKPLNAQARQKPSSSWAPPKPSNPKALQKPSGSQPPQISSNSQAVKKSEKSLRAEGRAARKQAFREAQKDPGRATGAAHPAESKAATWRTRPS